MQLFYSDAPNAFDAKRRGISPLSDAKNDEHFYLRFVSFIGSVDNHSPDMLYISPHLTRWSSCALLDAVLLKTALRPKLIIAAFNPLLPPPAELYINQGGGVGVRRRMNNELNSPPNFERLVLGCIDADSCK